MRGARYLLVLTSILSCSFLHAAESIRQKHCLEAASAKNGFDPKICAPLEAELAKIETDVGLIRKDKAWQAVCLKFGPGGCAPELDIDQDGKVDRIFLLSKGSGKTEQRLIAIRPGKGKLKILQKPSDVKVGNWGPGVKFELKKLTEWSVGSSNDPAYSEFNKYCDIEPDVKVLELWNDAMPYVLTYTKGRYCYMLIGD